VDWPPKGLWNGKDVYVIGGGPSLKDFPLSFLKSVKTIGCNDAYLLGEEVVDVLVFGDKKWWAHHNEKSEFLSFKNPVFTNTPNMKDEQRVIWAPREESGYFKEALGWNGNTGSVAINLALILGASKIYLIGFDMSLSDKGESNWHTNLLDTPSKVHYKRYKDALQRADGYRKKDWAEVEVINLNPQSNWDLYPKIDWQDHIRSTGWQGPQML